MNRTLLIAFSIFLCSCSRFIASYHVATSADLKPIINTRLYFVDSAEMLMVLEKNGFLDTFQFDLGASRNVVSQFPTGLNPKYVMTNTLKGIDGKIYQSKLFSLDSIKSPIFIWKNAPTVYTDIKPFSFCGRKTVTQLLGTGIVMGDKPLLINYSGGYLSYIDANFDKTGYIPIKARVNFAGRTMIKLPINGKEVEFLFDPGNSGFNYIKEAEVVSTQLKDGIKYESYSLDFKNNLVRSTGEAFLDIPVTLGDTITVKERFFSRKGMPMNNVGLSFIQKFDWIIDASNNKVYAKRITSKRPLGSRTRIAANQIPMISPNGHLIVGGVLVGKSKYSLGDQIVSVQNKPVTSENVCAMIEIVGKNPNWDSLNVVVQPMKL